MALWSASRLISGWSGAGLIALGVALAASGGAEQRRLESASDALSCARDALGGGRALSAVASLAVTFAVTPDAKNTRGRPSTTEITVAFPNKFKTTDRMAMPNGHDLVLVQGFVGDRQLVAPSDEDTLNTATPNDASLRRNHQAFARWALLLLLRDTPVVPVQWSPDLASDGAHYKIAATGADGFNMTLLLDKVNCQPVAATWDRAANYDDAMAGRMSADGRHTERRDLAEYRAFAGVRLPTRVRSAIDGVPRSEMKVTDVRINGPLPHDLATPRPSVRGASGRS